MKTIIILGALVFSTGVFAQGRTEIEKVGEKIGKTQTEIRKTEDQHHEAKEKIGQVKDQVSKISRKGSGNGDGNGDGTGNGGANGKGAKNEAMHHVDNANIQDKKEMLDGKIGQSRAADAKLKATQVKTKADADAMIRMSKEETKKTMSSIDSKMLMARTKLTEKLSSSEITQVQFDEKIKQLIDFEKRKNSIVNEMK